MENMKSFFISSCDYKEKTTILLIVVSRIYIVAITSVNIGMVAPTKYKIKPNIKMNGIYFFFSSKRIHMPNDIEQIAIGIAIYHLVSGKRIPFTTSCIISV
jgi:hypothetical protein